LFLKFVFNADGNPQWWADIRSAISEDSARNFLETIMEDAELPTEAPSPNEAAPQWPSAKRHTIDGERDAELAHVLSKTEIMIARFHETGHLTTLRNGQKLVDMLRHHGASVGSSASSMIVSRKFLAVSSEIAERISAHHWG
jgi:hypothetical protein